VRQRIQARHARLMHLRLASGACGNKVSRPWLVIVPARCARTRPGKAALLAGQNSSLAPPTEAGDAAMSRRGILWRYRSTAGR